MEHKEELCLEKSFKEEAMAASSPSPPPSFFAHPLSTMHHLAHGCAGYYLAGLSRLCRSPRILKPAPEVDDDVAITNTAATASAVSNT
ncbi:hypothetical protein ABZP36_031002 [Zizania latifolia]